MIDVKNKRGTYNTTHKYQTVLYVLFKHLEKRFSCIEYNTWDRSIAIAACRNLAIFFINGYREKEKLLPIYPILLSKSRIKIGVTGCLTKNKIMSLLFMYSHILKKFPFVFCSQIANMDRWEEVFLSGTIAKKNRNHCKLPEKVIQNDTQKGIFFCIFWDTL